MALKGKEEYLKSGTQAFESFVRKFWTKINRIDPSTLTACKNSAIGRH
jgi:hypothetical protein